MIYMCNYYYEDIMKDIDKLTKDGRKNIDVGRVIRF